MSMNKYSYDSNNWDLIGESIPGFTNGYNKAISISSKSDVIAIGSPTEIGTGAVRIYARNTFSCPTTWCQIGPELVGGDYED